MSDLVESNYRVGSDQLYLNNIQPRMNGFNGLLLYIGLLVYQNFKSKELRSIDCSLSCSDHH